MISGYNYQLNYMEHINNQTFHSLMYKWNNVLMAPLVLVDYYLNLVCASQEEIDATLTSEVTIIIQQTDYDVD